MKQFTLAAAGLVMAAQAATADPVDLYDVLESPERYDAGAYQTTFQCIRDTLTGFLGADGSEVELIEDDTEAFIAASTTDYYATITFSDEVAESEIVTIRSAEVFKMLGDEFQSSSYVGLNDRLPITSDAYNIGYEIDPAKSGAALDAYLRTCDQLAMV
ncbi:MAG: hypothetical protein AAGB32_03030 [Pseudomonadota bacterium]